MGVGEGPKFAFDAGNTFGRGLNQSEEFLASSLATWRALDTVCSCVMALSSGDLAMTGIWQQRRGVVCKGQE